MASISAEALAREILNRCISGASVQDVLDAFRELLECAAGPDSQGAAEAARALFNILAEGLADRFEPRLCEAYAALFSEAIARVVPEPAADQLLARYQRISRRLRFEGRADRIRDVYVLSRVTLGADVAITSVILEAVKRRFPQAAVYFVGPRKNWELFAGDPRVRWVEAAYARGGGLRERVAAGLALRAILEAPDGIVIDPDSRLTQLGLLPVCPEDRYYFFESRAYGADGRESLGELTRRWLHETFGVADARPYIAPAAEVSEPRDVTVSFGVGDNPAKRIPDPFEAELIGRLAARGMSVLVDTGGDEQEAVRVERAIAASGAPAALVRAFRGPFAAFAAHIARSRLYVGYDSAGQHAAAALGVPLVTVFAGFACERMFARWQPCGPGPKIVLRVDDPEPHRTLERTLQAIAQLT